MGRETGPIFRVARRLKFSILENQKEFSKGKMRTYGPGMHGQKRKRRQSAFGKQLIEKQKLRHLYQISEAQLKNLYKKTNKIPGVTSLMMLISLEKRLDNLVFRLGFTSTRRQARQLVNHGHVLVNGKRVDIPSYEVKINDVVSISKKARSFKFIQESLVLRKEVVPYIKRNDDSFSGQITRNPERTELNEDINEALIVEYYNRLL